MLNKKNIRFFSSLLISLLLLTGCGGKTSDTSPKATTEGALAYSKLFDCDLPLTVAIAPDGKIALDRRTGNEFFDKALEWTDIVQVSAGYNTLFGLDKSGKVYAACSDKSMETINLSNFNDITYISATDNGVYALTKDGKVMSTGAKALDVSSWENVKQISAGGDSSEIIIGLTKDGKVLVESGFEAVKEAADWTDIVQVSAGRLHVAGLKADGTVVTCGRALFEDRGDVGEFDVADWENIVYVTADNQTTAGLKADGTVVSTGYNAKEKHSEWTDAVGLYMGGNGTFALKADGTMTYSPLGDNFQLLK